MQADKTIDPVNAIHRVLSSHQQHRHARLVVRRERHLGLKVAIAGERLHRKIYLSSLGEGAQHFGLGADLGITWASTLRASSRLPAAMKSAARLTARITVMQSLFVPRFALKKGNHRQADGCDDYRRDGGTPQLLAPITQEPADQ